VKDNNILLVNINMSFIKLERKCVMKNQMISVLFILSIVIHPMSLASCLTANDNIITTTTDNRFNEINGEIKDTQTGLIWQICSIGQYLEEISGENNCLGVGNEYSWLEAFQIAKNERQKTQQKWRLPNIKELHSIINIRCYEPAIDNTIFPNTFSSKYWSSSSSIDSNDAWAVFFGYGTLGVERKDSRLNIRLVRTSQ
jgi:hypothetical protein